MGLWPTFGKFRNKWAVLNWVVRAWWACPYLSSRPLWMAFALLFLNNRHQHNREQCLPQIYSSNRLTPCHVMYKMYSCWVVLEKTFSVILHCHYIIVFFSAIKYVLYHYFGVGVLKRQSGSVLAVCNQCAVLAQPSIICKYTASIVENVFGIYDTVHSYWPYHRYQIFILNNIDN